MHKEHDKDRFQCVISWLETDPLRLACLHQVSQVMPHEWFIAAGFVRNLIWDRLHEKTTHTPLNDIDVIYMNSRDSSPNIDRELESILSSRMPNCHWSVKNQARMSLKHHHAPYLNCIDAMRYWPEVQTAVGASIDVGGRLFIESPFAAEQVVSLRVTRNARCRSDVFQERLRSKGWLATWPNLRVEA